jgi:hypothetical protein
MLILLKPFQIMSNNPKVEETIAQTVEFPTHESGVFLFKGNKNLKLEIDQQLLAVFVLPEAESTGIVLYTSNTVSKKLFELLEVLRKKIVSELELAPAEIDVKLFGCSQDNAPVVSATQTWLRAEGFKQKIVETGQEVSRTLVIECKTGRVGVGYAESATLKPLLFVAEGSARERFESGKVEHKILVLCENKIDRHLVKQAIEEDPTLEGVYLDDFNQSFRQKLGNWDAVLISAELEKSKIYSTIKSNKNIAWLGKNSKNDKPQLPKPTPDTMGEFKESLSKWVESLPAYTETSSLLFPLFGKAK